MLKKVKCEWPVEEVDTETLLILYENIRDNMRIEWGQLEVLCEELSDRGETIV